MDDEKKWNLNAPQNDTENNRQNEPPRKKTKNVEEKNLQKRFRWQLYSGW